MPAPKRTTANTARTIFAKPPMTRTGAMGVRLGACQRRFAACRHPPERRAERLRRPAGLAEQRAGAGLGEADGEVAQQAGPAVEAGVLAGAEQRPREHRDRLDLALAAALDPAGDGGVRALAEEDHAVRLRGGLHRAEKAREPLGERRLEVAVGSGGKRRGDLTQNALLLAREKRLEQLVLRRVAGINDRLGDAGGPGDRVHGGAVVTVLEEQLEGGVQDHRPAALGAEVGGARRPRGGGVVCGPRHSYLW